MAPFRVLIIDDHPIVLSGLRLLLEGEPRFELCGQASTAGEAVAAAERLHPDLIIADLVLGADDGLGMIEDLTVAAPSARILVYSSREEMVYARRALAHGAQGYVSKAEGLDRVAEGLDTLMRGDVHLSPAVGQALLNDLARADGIAALSARELQVFEMTGEGRSLQAQALQLGVTVKTIGTYRERLKTKLGLDSVRMVERFAEEHLARSRRPS